MKVKNINQSVCAVVLPGGGARGAYQAGALKAIAEFFPGDANPFPVICGTSAGAINAAVLASHAHEFGYGVERLTQFWSTMHCDRIYRTDAWTILTSGLRWVVSLVTGGHVNIAPPALLDNAPLRRFLHDTLQLDGIDVAIEQGALRGVSITASAYTRASAISFFQGREDIEPWKRSRREGVIARLSVEHLLASAALPLLFPAQRIGMEFYGDGGMRMIAPISPAIHLGADRILVIGTRDEHPDPAPVTAAAYPGPGEIGGYLLDTIFMDTLNADLARMERINRTLESIPASKRGDVHLKTIESLLIRPSEDLRKVTQRHAGSIPPGVRLLLRTLGAWGRDWRMASYLLFESPYCQELMQMGYQDALLDRDRIIDFIALCD